MARADQGAAHNLESSEGQGAHPRTPSQSDAAARPEATLPGPESVATNERGDLPIGFCHRMGEHQAHSYEYMDATYWCRGVGQKPDAARRPRWWPIPNSVPKSMGFARYCWFVGFFSGWFAYWIVVTYAS